MDNNEEKKNIYRARTWFTRPGLTKTHFCCNNRGCQNRLMTNSLNIIVSPLISMKQETGATGAEQPVFEDAVLSTGS